MNARLLIQAFREGLSSFYFHLYCYFLNSMFLNTFEYAGKYQRVIDLILEVTSPTSVNESSILFCFLWQYLRSGISQSKYYRVYHLLYPLALQCACRRNTNKHFCAFNYCFKWSCLFLEICESSYLVFCCIHSFGSSLINCTFCITNYDIFGSKSFEQLRNGDSCCSCPINNNFGVFDGLLSHFQGID